jgi:hypothetical protein
MQTNTGFTPYIEDAQNEFKARNAQLAEDRRMKFRMGAISGM